MHIAQHDWPTCQRGELRTQLCSSMCRPQGHCLPSTANDSRISSCEMALCFSAREISLASLVMKQMNSLTNSCIRFLASRATFASLGSSMAMRRPTFANGNRRSCSRSGGGGSLCAGREAGGCLGCMSGCSCGAGARFRLTGRTPGCAIRRVECRCGVLARSTRHSTTELGSMRAPDWSVDWTDESDLGSHWGSGWADEHVSVGSVRPCR